MAEEEAVALNWTRKKREECEREREERNVGQIGEDIKKGDRVFEEGHLLRPCDVAVLASLGFDRVKVFKKPVVAIIPTGDELVSRKKSVDVPPLGKMIETNGLMSALYVKKWGGIPRCTEIVPDNPGRQTTGTLFIIPSAAGFPGLAPMPCTSNSPRAAKISGA